MYHAAVSAEGLGVRGAARCHPPDSVDVTTIGSCVFAHIVPPLIVGYNPSPDTMTKRNRGPRGAIGNKGARGPRGRRGARGAAGLIGQRGQTGPAGGKGPKGPKGLPQHDALLGIVEQRFNDVYKQLDVQLRRMAQIQQQLDELGQVVRRHDSIKSGGRSTR